MHFHFVMFYLVLFFLPFFFFSFFLSSTLHSFLVGLQRHSVDIRLRPFCPQFPKYILLLSFPHLQKKTQTHLMTTVALA